MLEYWLRQLPDGSFPNVSLVQDLLQCIDGMQIDARHLDCNELGKIIRYYSEGLPHMDVVKGLAKQIHDRWCRMLYEIKTGYDAEGRFDRQYRSLKKHQEQGDSSQEESSEEQKEPELATNPQAHGEIKRGRVGIIMPHRNAFDFTQRPKITSDNIGG
jgi:hypothetical protein